MTELCGPAPFELYDCGSGRFWLKEGRAVRLLEADDALLLQSVEGFRTLREHLSLLELRGFAEVEPGDLAARLEELRGRGLLVSAAAFVDRLPRSGGAPAAIGCAAWVTRGRPALVTRSVRSWLDRRGRVDSPRLAVLDDSEDEQSRAALGRLAEDGTPLWYAGRAEKRAFAGRLADRGIPAEVLSFALSPSPDLGTPYGANRNAFLLATCGEVVLSSDDDILFEAAALPEMDGGLAISSRLDPAGIRYFAGRESLRAALQPVGNPRALLASKTSEEPRPPTYHVPGFDPHLEAIVLRAIERDPRDRYGSAKQLLADVLDPSAVPPRDPETGERRRRLRAASRRRGLLGVLVAVVLAALASLVWLTERRSGAATPRQPAPAGLRAR